MNTKKHYLATAFALFCEASFADRAPSADLCKNVNGFYSGTYSDTTNLFPNRPFPITLFLTHEGNTVYGYTLPAKDKRGAAYGQKPYAIFFATCQKNALHHLYLIKNTEIKCGDFAQGPFALNAENALNFHINWGNAMISADFVATLVPATINQPVDANLLSAALRLSQSSVQSCTD